MKWLGSALLSVGLPLLLAEVTEVAPWLAARLLKSAARVLPPEHHKRYESEWLAELDAVPGRLFKLLFAFRIAIRTPAVKRELCPAEPLIIRLGRWLSARLVTFALAVASRAYRWWAEMDSTYKMVEREHKRTLLRTDLLRVLDKPPAAIFLDEPKPIMTEAELIDRDDLYAILRAWRRSRASADGAPPYVTVSKRTLADLARRRPQTRDELLKTEGIGPVIERLGGGLLIVVEGEDEDD